METLFAIGFPYVFAGVPKLDKIEFSTIHAG